MTSEDTTHIEWGEEPSETWLELRHNEHGEYKHIAVNQEVAKEHNVTFEGVIPKSELEDVIDELDKRAKVRDERGYRDAKRLVREFLEGHE